MNATQPTIAKPVAAQPLPVGVAVAQPVVAQPAVVAANPAALPPLEVRLDAFYRKHNPAKLPTAPGNSFAATCHQYRHNEAGLNQALINTYGQGLDQIATAPQSYAVQQPQTTVVYAQQPRVMMSENYCGPISLIIGLCVPCGCWICLCPVDQQQIVAY